MARTLGGKVPCRTASQYDQIILHNWFLLWNCTFFVSCIISFSAPQ